MKIYQAEKEAGLEQKITANASVAYTMPTILDKDITSGKSVSTKINDEIDWLISKASAEDDDVYKVYSILVTTSWNKNDDVFSPDEVWASRQSPLYKPTNLEHDEKQIVGSIIGNWPVDKNFDLIKEDIDIKDLPDVYHLLVASVIYRQWQDPEYKSRAEQLIREVSSGQKAVSMECIFKGFDYAVESPNGEYHIVSRGENTAFLTQHLRAYGGNGVYQDHKVGRLLRNITFSGKGFVNNPANPDSIIFSTDRDFPFSKASCVEDLFSNKKSVSININENPISKNLWENNMSDYLEKEVADLKTALEASKAEVKELNEKLSQASVKEYESQIEELKANIQNLETEKQSYVVASEKAEETIKNLEASIADLSEKLTQAQEDMKKMEEEKKKEKRMASLIEVGMDAEEAAAQIESFANLSDDQFEVFAGMMKKYMKGGNVKADEDSETASKCGEDKMKKDAKAEEVEEAEASDASEDVLDNVEPSDEVNVSIASTDEDKEEEAMASLRENLQAWVSKRVFNQE